MHNTRRNPTGFRTIKGEPFMGRPVLRVYEFDAYIGEVLELAQTEARIQGHTVYAGNSRILAIKALRREARARGYGRIL